MDPVMYRAAQSGNSDAIKGIPASAYTQRTATGNTVLHILAQCSCDFPEDVAKHILSQKPDMVFQTNNEGETPLHVAARRGHLGVVRALIGFPGNERVLVDLLGAVNQRGNTAVHVAVTYNRCDVVELLLNATPTELPYVENYGGESPLYVAVEKGNYEIVKLILSLCKSPSYHGPERRTALHAAALTNSTECLELILKKIPLINKEVNATGWTALHYAAKNNNKNVVKFLLSKDKSMGYITANADDSVTALHVAAIHGHQDVMHEIVSRCPNSWKMVTRKQKNLLHLAVENEQKHVLEFILESQWATELINEQDHKGNTPLHLYACTKSLEGSSIVIHPFADKNMFNHDGFTPIGMIVQEETVLTERQVFIKGQLERAGATRGLLHMITRLDETLSDDLKDLIRKQDTPLVNAAHKYLESYMLVGTLIATVTFAAGFTLPGGYNTKDGKEAGLAVLSKRSAFAAFVVTDSLALMFACTSVFLQFMVMIRKGNMRWNLFYYSKVILILAIGSLMAAFLSGVHAVVPVKKIHQFLVMYGITFGLIVVVAFIVNLFSEPNTGDEEKSNEQNA